MNEIEKILVGLDPQNPESKEQITRLYQLLDEACDTHKITISEWRILLDRVAALKAETSRNRNITKQH